MTTTKIIFGCGYLGLRVAKRWLHRGDAVFAVTRSPDRKKQLSGMGLQPLVCDILKPDSLTCIPSAETILFAVGYDRSSADPIHRVYVDGLRNVLHALPLGVQRFIYISSTGVYGQSDGDWVDEDSSCNPIRAGGTACLDAERTLRAHPIGRRAIILRMAGIYGPGRIPRSRELRAGQPLAAPRAGFLNLIHVEDAAEAVLAAESRAPLGSIYCVADGHPVLRSEYYQELARLFQSPPPVFAPPPAGSAALERAGSSKRVSNQRLVSQVGLQLEYPNYREGLAAIVQSAEKPGR